MMLVDAHRIEPAFGGEFELVHKVVVHQMRAPRVEQRGVYIDPDRGVLLSEILRQFGIGHQVKPHQLHGDGSSWCGGRPLSSASACPRPPIPSRSERLFRLLYQAEI